MTHTFSPDVIKALAELREVARLNQAEVRVVEALNTLDDAGVFAALDEQTDYASAEEILAESAAMHLSGRLMTLDPALYPQGTVVAVDPAEWGDTTRADMARHQGYASVSGLGELERVPGTNTLRPAPKADVQPLDEPLYGEAARQVRDALRDDMHEHVYPDGDPETVCLYRSCSLTYAEYREQN